jgi:hypothetical protein
VELLRAVQGVGLQLRVSALEHEGIFYYFRHANGKHTPVLADPKIAYRDCSEKEVPYVRELASRLHAEHITDWKHRFPPPSRPINRLCPLGDWHALTNRSKIGRNSRESAKRERTGPAMFYEDVKLKSRETVSELGVAYGYRSSDWKKIWDDRKNQALVRSRGKPERLQVGDVLQIPILWKMTTKTLVLHASGAGLTVVRSGQKGTRLRWAQTVYQHNQAIGTTSAFCVDGCPADDADPFYWTSAELAGNPTLRKKFTDKPSRPAPTWVTGTTKWRAVLSIAVLTDRRATVFESIVWGFNVTPTGAYSKVGPRAATAAEVKGHLNLLRKGVGTGFGTFSVQGWTFRSA